MAKYFGTDGVRGKANVFPMSADFVLRLGQAIGLHFRSDRHRRVLIGKDTRRSGYMLEQALSSGICSVGVDVGLIGPLPTPGIAYLTRGMRACAGIVISASHNHYEDNGIKIFAADGYKLPDEIEDELERMVDNPELLESRLSHGGEIGRTRRIDDAIGQYAVFLKEQFPKHLTLDGLRIVVDCANGAAYKVAPKVFEELGAEVFLVGVEPDGTNINEQVGALYPQQLRERVLLYKADIGIGLDGDADRLIVVDNKGDTVDGDHIMAMCARHMSRLGTLRHNTVVSTIMSNMGLEVALARFDAKLLRTKVGDRYVVEAMRQGNFNLGGEQSGHLIFRDSSTTGDGLLAALHLLEIVLTEGKSVHDLKQIMQHMPQVIKNVKVREKVPLENLPTLGAMIAKAEKELAGQGRVVFRYSGTEKLARVMIEGPDADVIDRMADELCEETVKAIASVAGGAK